MKTEEILLNELEKERLSDMQDHEFADDIISDYEKHYEPTVRRIPDYCSFDYNSDYIIEGVMNKGDFTNIISPSKTGATALAMQMAVAVDNGWDFLGMKTQKVPVLFIDCDGHPHIGQIFQNIRMAYKTTVDHLQYLNFSKALLLTDNPLETFANKLHGYMLKYPEARLIIIDSFSAITMGSDFTSIRNGILQLKSIAAKYNTALCYTCHTDSTGVEGIKAFKNTTNPKSGHYIESDFSYALWRTGRSPDQFWLQSSSDMADSKQIKLWRPAGSFQPFEVNI